MAKVIRFPLHLADGTGARTLEDLREHGDVESVLRHYREGTLARWLKAFGHTELAERVAEHRNAQLEGSGANLREVFGILEIPLAEEAFAEYCKKSLIEEKLALNAFRGCDELTSIEIPAGVTSIGEAAFWDCSELASVRFEDTTDWYVTDDETNAKNKTGGGSSCLVSHKLGGQC